MGNGLQAVSRVWSPHKRLFGPTYNLDYVVFHSDTSSIIGFPLSPTGRYEPRRFQLVHDFLWCSSLWQWKVFHRVAVFVIERAAHTTIEEGDVLNWKEIA